MKKFLTVVKREYLQRLRAKMFIVSTILLPVVMSLFVLVPAIILNIPAGAPMRVAVVDQTGKLYPLLHASMIDEEADEQTNANENTGSQSSMRRRFADFRLEEIDAANRSLEEIRTDLDRRLREKQIDGYLILPPDFLSQGQAEFFN